MIGTSEKGNPFIQATPADSLRQGQKSCAKTVKKWLRVKIYLVIMSLLLYATDFFFF